MKKLELCMYRRFWFWDGISCCSELEFIYWSKAVAFIGPPLRKPYEFPEIWATEPIREPSGWEIIGDCPNCWLF